MARYWISACLALAALTAASSFAHAADYPTRPVTVIVPYAAGGFTDAMARIVTDRLSSRLGQPFVIDNRGGAGGAIGTAFVAKAPPDGYTLLFATAAQIHVVPYVQKVAYDPDKDFAPVSILASGAQILAINAAVPAQTVQDFVAYVKANPGKVNYASAGAGSIGHLAAALFAQRAGLDMVHVPYKGGAPALTDLLGGQVQMYFGNAAEIIPQAPAGKIRLLAVATAERLPQLPDVPALGEIYSGFRIAGWNGLLAPAGTPQAIVDALASEAAAAGKDAVNIERMTKLGVTPKGTTAAEFRESMGQDGPPLKQAVSAAGLKPE